MQSTLVLLSLTLLAAPAQKADEPKEAKATLLTMKPLAADPKDDELHKLMKERFNAALIEVQILQKHYQAGKIDLHDLFDAVTRLKTAGLELHDDPKEKKALLEEYIELAKGIERLAEARVQAGLAIETEVQRARYYRADAEIALLRLKNEKPK